MNIRTLGILILLTAISLYIGHLFPLIGSVIPAIFLGLLVNLFKIYPNSGDLFRKKTEKYSLETAIVLLGLGINLSQGAGMNWKWLLILAFMIIGNLFIGRFLHNYFNVSRSCGAFLGGGNAICGNAAILAISGLIPFDNRSLGVSITVINILCIVAMLIVPGLGWLFGLSSIETAALAGGSIQSVGHTLAVGFAYGNESGEVATLFKMTRVGLLLPSLALVFLLFRNSKANKESEAPIKIAIPWYFWGFIATLGLNYFFELPPALLQWSKHIVNIALTIGMVSIGIGLSFQGIREKGWPAFRLGSVQFVFQLVLLILGIKFIGIG